jgi:ubiquinone/menaquinone biosynthesis C-methylase UbiE
MSANPQSFDPEQFKAQQRQMWDNAAAGWQAWWENIERGAQKVSDKLVEMAQIKPGDKVLDIATGIGEPAVTAAMRVKPNGKVVATDISPRMIAIAKSRAKSLGLDSIMEFREGDAEKLDLPKSSFNTILSRWGLMFLPNLPAALVEIRKLLVPGGRLSAAVWSTPSKVPFLDLAFSTVRKQINAPPPPPGTLGPFSLADTEALKRSFTQAGFKDVQVESFLITFSFDSAETYTRFQQAVTAPIQAMLANQTEEKKKQAWDAITDAVSKYADSHGRVSIDNEVICIVGNSYV